MISKYLLPIFLVLFASTSLAETKESCSEKFDSWLDAYTSSNVFVAFNKAQKHKFSVEEIRKSIQLSVYKNLDNFYDSKTDKLRMKEMLKQLHTIFDESEKSDLVLVLAGGAHIVDAYLHRPNDPETAYVATKIDSSVRKYSKKLREFVDKKCVGLRPSGQAAIIKKTCGTNAACLIAGCDAGVRLLESEKEGRRTRILHDLIAAYVKGSPRIDIAHLLQRTVPRPAGTFPQRILIGDTHNFDATAIFNDLPRAECIHHLGYRKVKLVFEGIASNERIIGDELRDYLDRINYFQTLNYAEQNLNYLKNLVFRYSFRSDLEELDQTGMSSHPSFLAFAEYGTKLARRGINVEFLGFDVMNLLGYPVRKNSEAADILSRTSHYRCNNIDRLLVVDKEGLWYTSIEFQGVGRIQFFSGEHRIVVNHLQKCSPPPKKVSESWCGIQKCTTLQFSDSNEQVTIYSSDESKFLELFE